MSASAPEARARAAFDAVRGQLMGADVAWLDSLRARALEQLEAEGFPGRKNEAWKYTSTRPILKADLPPATADDEALAVARASVPRLQTRFDRLVFVDGLFSDAHSRVRTPGLVVGSLRAVLGDDPDRIRDALASAAEVEGEAFTALNTALMDDGAYVYVPDGTVMEYPLELVFVGSGSDRGVHLRNLIVVGANAEARVVERYLGVGDGAQLTNVVTEVRVGANSSLAHVQLQSEGAGTFHVARLAVAQERDSRLHHTQVSVGGRLSRTQLEVRLEGAGAEADLAGLALGSDTQHHDHHVDITHAVPHCRSNQLFKHVLADRARGVFTGRVVVAEDAQKTDAQQSNKNLLLSDEAMANTRPQLEIYADDVKCSHGATVGQLDHDAVFYLRSRGLSEEQTRGLLTYAFANEIVHQAPEWCRDGLETALWEWLGRRGEAL